MLLKGRFSGSFHLNIEKNDKTPRFLTSSVNSCGASNWELKKVQNQRLFRKHRILRIKIKTLFLGLFSWSSEFNLYVRTQPIWILHKNRGASNWEWTPQKNHGAHDRICTADGEANRFSHKLQAFWQIKIRPGAFSTFKPKAPQCCLQKFGAPVQERPLSQSPGALHLKSKIYWSLILNVMFFLELPG